MYEIKGVVEARRFAEEEVTDALREFDVLYPFEPNEFALVRSVIERSTEPHGFSDTNSVPFGHLADNLYVRVFVVQFGNTVETAAVDILVRVLAYHIQCRIDTEFFTKNVGTLGTDILAIGYISMS